MQAFWNSLEGVALEYHLEQRIVLDRESEFKNLYQWSLQEFDQEGKKIGRDQIPWAWDLYFMATELTLSDAVRVEEEYQFESDDTKLVNHASQSILAKLQPGRRGHRGTHHTSYSMFGTARQISDFRLIVEELAKADAQPTCRAWGSVSYTMDFDFRDETFDDSVTFYLYVTSTTFAEYARKIQSGSINELIFRAGGVDGFYSDWSPSISTYHIKVLTDHKEHEVEMPSDSEVVLPRLGRVRQAELYLRHINELKGLPPEPDDDCAEEASPNENVGGSVFTPPAPDEDARTVALLSSLRLAAWVIASLLVLLVIRIYG